MICNKSKIKTKETGKNMKKIAIVILLLLTLCLCGCERNEGEIMENDPFYSLQKIYNDKLLTRDELRKINRKYYEETNFDLSEDLASEIKDDYRRVYKVKDDEEIIINRCIGIYENLVVIMIFSENQIFHSCIIEEMIGGFSFTYVCNQKIIVWKKTK